MNRFISISKRFSNQSSILTKMNRQNNNVLFCHHYSTSLMNQTDFPINSFSNRFSSLSNRNSIQTRNYAKKSKKKGAGGGKKKRKKGAGEGDPNNIVITLHDIEKHFRDGVQIFSNVTMGKIIIILIIIFLNNALINDRFVFQKKKILQFSSSSSF